MAYATLDDVSSRVPSQLWDPDAASPQPSVATVTAWLEQLSSWVDSSLSWRYQSPDGNAPIVRNTQDQGLLTQPVALLVAAQIWDLLGGFGRDEPSNGATLRRSAYDLLAYNRTDGRSYLVLPNTDEGTTGSGGGTGLPIGSFTDPAAGGKPRLFPNCLKW